MTQPRLVAVEGSLRGQTFDLGEDELSIGRVGHASLAIDHMSVSRRHCVIAKHGAAFKVQDQGSRNGTLVNGKRVVERVLEHGDRLVVGNSAFIFLTQEDDVSSLLGSVRLSDEAIDPAETRILRSENAVYLSPEKALAGFADTRVAHDFGVLLKLGTAIRSSENLPALAEHALALIMQAIPAEAGAILLTGGHKDRIASMFAKTLDGTNAVAVSQTVVNRVLSEGTALLNNAVTETMPDNQSLIGSRVRSLLCAPLMSGDRLLGVIYLVCLATGRPFDQSHLELVVAMAAMLALPLDSAQRVDWLESENRRLQTDIDGDCRLIGDSAAMKQLYRFIARVAPTDSTVLVRGESGTGKELVARALHRGSRRAKGPFVAINCAALTAELLESDLFGHEKGAFTSAVAQRKGKFEIADGGTVFLDEVAELAPDLQVKLLRVLQEREFERVGGTRPIKVDVRIIAATDRDLEEAIAAGRFRHELYYRLNVVSIESPPLRDHAEDIVTLANYFVARYAARYNNRIRGMSRDAEACLAKYDWPGNVRELQNAIERAVVLGESDLILPEDLPESIIEAHPPNSGGSMGFHDGVREDKRRRIQKALDQSGGNHVEAAKLLGVNRTYLHRLIRNLDLPKD